MKKTLAVLFVTLLTTTACTKPTDALPVATANARAPASTDVGAFSIMHSAIAAVAGSDITEYH